MIESNIIITTNIYPPEIHPSGVMNDELSAELAHIGYCVKVLTCFPSHPQGRLYPGWKRRFIEQRNKKMFEIIRAWHPISTSNGFFKRSIVMIGQGISYLISAKEISNAEIIISDGPPVVGLLISALLAKRHQARLIFILHDFVVDITNNIFKFPKFSMPLFRKIELISYRLADKIIVLSEGFRRTLIEEKGVAPGKVAVIPVWLDGRDILPTERDNPWRRQMGIEPEKFVVLYAGTIGLVSGAEVVVETARRLQSHQDILFLLVGEGQAKDRVEAMARKAGLNNIRFLPFQPRERLSELQATADVSLVTLAPGRGKTSVPSKVLGYMAAARPVVAAVDKGCDTAELIRTSGCGLVVPPGQGYELAEAILHFYENPKERLMRGEVGHRHFLQHFERQAVLNRYIETIQNVLKSSRETHLNPEIFAEWLQRQGQRVLRTDSSYWVECGFRVFQAFPYHWLIQPGEKELTGLFKSHHAIGLRYSTPLDMPEGCLSYHAVFAESAYDLKKLGKKARYDVRLGLKNCEIKHIPFEQLAQEGWLLQKDTLERQGRNVTAPMERWRTLCKAAADLPGFDAWGALVRGRLVASLITFQMGDCCYILSQQSLREFLLMRVNNALIFLVTQTMVGRPGVKSIFYGLHSLDAPASVDEFKFRMGYAAKPVRQRVVFHSWLKPVFNRYSHAAVRRLLAWRSGDPILAKAEGMMRFYREGKHPLAEQQWPECYELDVSLIQTG